MEGREGAHRLESRVVRGQEVGKDGKWGKWKIRKEGRRIGRVGVTGVKYCSAVSMLELMCKLLRELVWSTSGS